MTLNTSRRGFLKGAAAASAVLLVGVRPDGAVAAVSTEGTAFNPFVKIGSDGTVTAIIKHFEKGQGPATGLSTLIAEEIGLRMDQMAYEFAPSNPEIYNNLMFGPFQGTGGSTAMANSFMQYRQAGAAAREMLIQAAADAWGVDGASLSIRDGVVEGASDAVEGAADMASDAVEGATEAVEGAADAATDAAADVMENASDAVEGAADAATDAASDVVEGASK